MNTAATPLDPQFMAIVECPVTRQKLSEAGAGELERIRGQIAAGRLVHADGRKPAGNLDHALITADGLRVYPIRNGILILLAEECLINV
jgi:uncharacterized protein